MNTNYLTLSLIYKKENEKVIDNLNLKMLQNVISIINLKFKCILINLQNIFVNYWNWLINYKFLLIYKYLKDLLKIFIALNIFILYCREFKNFD